MLDSVSGCSQADEQPARSRQILLAKGVDEPMQSCAGVIDHRCLLAPSLCGGVLRDLLNFLTQLPLGVPQIVGRL
jgi:hypothetical protein